MVEEDDGKPDQVAASHILIAFKGADSAGEDVTRSKPEAEAFAKDVLAQALADPSKFADLAKQHSDGPSAEKGGDLGTFKFEAMAPAFSEAAFALEINAITEAPVETGFGYHIIQRTK